MGRRSDRKVFTSFRAVQRVDLPRDIQPLCQDCATILRPRRPLIHARPAFLEGRHAPPPIWLDEDGLRCPTRPGPTCDWDEPVLRLSSEGESRAVVAPTGFEPVFQP